MAKNQMCSNSGFILLKTHKFDASAIIEADDIINSCKVRPIVSCCNSPTEKLSWLVTHLLTPFWTIYQPTLRTRTNIWRRYCP